MSINLNLSAMGARVGAMLAAVLVLLALASPAEARRKVSFGSTGSKSTSAPKAPPAAASGMNKVLYAAIMTRAALKVTAKRLTKVHDLPEDERTKLPDGRHVHIGALTGVVYGKSYVGWVSQTEYIKLSSTELGQLLLIAGFYSVQELEEYLATTPPPAQDTEATVAAAQAEAEAPATSTGLSTAAMATLAGLVALLAGFIGYCIMAARGNRDSGRPSTISPRVSNRIARPAAAPAVAVKAAAPQPASRPPASASLAAPARASRVAAAAAPVAVKPALSSASASAPSPRRAPRDLGALTRKPQLA